MNIHDEVLSLKLPANSYVVVGSGIMHALKIRESEDIDMIVSKDVYETLDKQGWSHGKWPDQTVLRKGPFDLGVHWMGEEVDELLRKSTTINTIPYLSLEDVLNWKRTKARPKDLADVQLILEYRAKG